MNYPSLILIFLLQGLCLSQVQFILHSELRTGYSGANPVSTFTAYRYDNNGNRTQRRVFDGIDRAAALMSSIEYLNDDNGRCIEERLLNANEQTLSTVRYSHGPDGLLSAATLRSDGSVRFSDSLLYENGLLREQRRYSSSGMLVWYHRYTCSEGLCVSDSLFEPDSTGAFAATQIRLMSHAGNGEVESEILWRMSEGIWYVISTTVMAFADTHLVSATTYEGDGFSKRLLDSLAYSVDAYGNRILEEHFDREQTKTCQIAYTWLEAFPTAIYKPTRHMENGFAQVRNSTLQFGSTVSGYLVLSRLDGCRVHSQPLNGKSFIELPSHLSSGTFVATVVSETITRSYSLSIIH
ncbi:MAG: hypothetical protein GF398_01655 [Chitinivibrionales bacterium]|nr:hypothetical protein [Chitinivibrionales bacterium]